MSRNGRRRTKLRSASLVLLAFGAAQLAWAGGPRFVTGTSFLGAPQGQAMAFFTSQPLYYTDPGDLSATVTHAQADAMVAAAASVWNVPPASLILAQGGVLAEHVSGTNSYFDGNGIVFPQDVQANNYVAKPIAVIYDTDGSMTDLLLGSGASDPSSCRQNGVTESVDQFGDNGTIQHAVIVLNGRCVGPAPQQLVQMQYQLMRKFGRVLGLAWSQCNDNVFTAANTVSKGQLANWPVMHPIDVICGTYTYQCIPNPFMLRPDDVSTLAMLYPVTSANLTPGKVVSTANSFALRDGVYFPTIQGMDQVNVTVTWGIFGLFYDDFQTASGVVGALYQRDGGNPVVANPQGGNVGGSFGEFIFSMARIPLDFSEGKQNQVGVTTEGINPLYSGDYAIGTYEGTPIAMSGTSMTIGGWFANANTPWSFALVSNTASSSCNPGNDGKEWAAVLPDPSGWWTGLLCGPGHVSWWSASVKAGRTWTVETTAVDETGLASTRKMRPVIGVWNGDDPMGTLATVAATPSAMNSFSVGMTQLQVPSAKQDAGLRIAIADQFGGGRPDFNYKARLLYADSLSPAIVATSGGRITISGMGFRQGNQVTVNGVSATVIRWTANTIVATAPSMAAAKMSAGVAADVAVIDKGTGGETVMSAVLMYSAAANDTIKLVSAPAALETGFAAAVPFAARVFAADGVTAVAGASVNLAATGGATLAACVGAASCVLVCDATGLAQTAVMGTSVGAVTLTATEVSGGASVVATVNDVDPVRTVTPATLPRYLAAGAAVGWNVSVVAMQDGAPAVGSTVVWTAIGGLSVAGLPSLTDATGTASAAVQTAGLAAGTQGVVTGCVWTTVCASSIAYGVGAPLWRVAVSSGAGQSVKFAATLTPVVLLVTDDAGHPLQGATVQIAQTVDAWEGVCPATGRCPAAPVIASGKSTAVSDANGQVTVTPLEVAGVPEVVNIAASAGTQGFVALALTKTP